jgi:4-amino-4-deoxy-L-arabinose transferase-like glycosyltransferase
MGLASYLPKKAWALVLALGVIAVGSLLVPYELIGDAIGLSFELFFILVSGIQLATALGIGAVVVRYRGRNEQEVSEWRYH